MSSNDHISEEEFLLEFFGNFGREFGDPHSYFVDNPSLIMQFIKDCEIGKKPAFISVQPREGHHKNFGLEKLFFDFDYGKKSDKLSKWEIVVKRIELDKEVLNFANYLTNIRIPKLQPMIVKTRKGYHFYIYFDKVYQLDGPEKFVKEVYATLTDQLKSAYETRYGEMKYSDSSVREDIYRMARIPLSIHEKSGQKCLFQKFKVGKDGPSFEQDKIRGLAYFKNYSLKEEELVKAIKITRLRIEAKERLREKAKEEQKIKREMSHGYIGKIRPCFQKTLLSGEMNHQQRLALLIESWYAGTQTLEGLVEVFRPLHDFDGDKASGSVCRYQCQWFMDHKKYEAPPYSCGKMQELNWCIENDCEIFRKRNNEQKPEEK